MLDVLALVETIAGPCSSDCFAFYDGDGFFSDRMGSIKLQFLLNILPRYSGGILYRQLLAVKPDGLFSGNLCQMTLSVGVQPDSLQIIRMEEAFCIPNIGD